MLRVHFSPGDLARIRLATTVDPLWEIVLSLQRLQTTDGALLYDDWLTAARQSLDSRSGRAALHVLTSIAPRQRYFPDFLTPAESQRGLEIGLDAVRSTPRVRLTAELEKVYRYRGQRTPTWMAPLANSDHRAMTGLGAMLDSYYRGAIAPHLRHIESAVAADRAIRARALAAGGVDGLFASFDASWEGGVLRLPYPSAVDIHLRGRGVTFIPSFFCWGKPVALSNQDLPPVIVYPIEHQLGRWREAGQPLRSLLGSTRAEMLARIGDGATTGELAAALGVTPGAATHHTAVLREAGVITTVRQGTSVVHSITPLGEALLTGARRLG